MRVLYVVPTFPQLSETFIRLEIEDHLRHGLDVRVLSYTPPKSAQALASLAPDLRARTRHGAARRSLTARLGAAGGALARRPIALGALAASLLSTPALRSRTADLLALADRFDHSFAPDLIHAHFGRTGLGVAALQTRGLAPDAPLVTTFHGRDVTAAGARHGPELYAPLFARGALLLPVNRIFAERLTQAGADPAKVVVQRAPTDAGAVAFRPRRRRPGEPLRIVSVGRLSQKKGHDVLLRAFAALRRMRPDLDARLTIVGGGEEEARLRALIADLGLGSEALLTGALPHDQTLKRLEAAHLFALASRTAENGDTEGLPVSLMEALAHGLPAVSTRHAGIPELLADGVTGALAEEGDVEGFARALEKTADADWEVLARAGRDRVMAEFDIGATGRRLRALYDGLAQRR